MDEIDIAGLVHINGLQLVVHRHQFLSLFCPYAVEVFNPGDQNLLELGRGVEV